MGTEGSNINRYNLIVSRASSSAGLNMSFQVTSVIYFSSSLLVAAAALPSECYYCTDDPNFSDDPSYYDPECSAVDYNNGAFTAPTDSHWDRCATRIFYEVGYIRRGTTSVSGDDDGCDYDSGLYGDYVACICTSG